MYSDAFLNDSYLKYVGWTLHDRVSIVHSHTQQSALEAAAAVLPSTASSLAYKEIVLFPHLVSFNQVTSRYWFKLGGSTPSLLGPCPFHVFSLCWSILIEILPRGFSVDYKRRRSLLRAPLRASVSEAEWKRVFHLHCPKVRGKKEISGSSTDTTGSTTSGVIISSLSLPWRIFSRFSLVFSSENHWNTSWMQKRCFSGSAQFLVLMVSTWFLQQEEPILGADTGLCTSAWEFCTPGSSGTGCAPTPTKTPGITCFTLNSLANTVQGIQRRLTVLLQCSLISSILIQTILLF